MGTDIHATMERLTANLQTLAERLGYWVEYRPTVYTRGWPRPSAKPFGLYWLDGGHIASFATIEALERNLRARGGC